MAKTPKRKIAKKAAAGTNEVLPAYEPTDVERTIVDAYFEEQKTNPAHRLCVSPQSPDR